MKLKIVQAGFETYTGLFGIVEFKDGISTDHVNHVERAHLCALIACEEFDDSGKEELALTHDAAPADQAAQGEQSAADTPATPADQTKQDEQPAAPAEQASQATGEDKPAYTREALEKIADEKGIGGLREIGDALGVKATSIAKLIEEILEAAAK